METKVEFTTDLLYFARKKCKAKSLEESINECFQMADKAKSKAIPLLLYKDCVKIKDHKGNIQLSNVKGVSEFKEPMILVLCSNHKRGKKCLLTTLKFKTVNGYVNVLCKIKNIVRIEEARGKLRAQSDVTSATDFELMKQGLRKRDIAMNDQFRLPRGRVSMPREDGKSQKMSQPATDTIQERKRRQNFKSASLIEQNILNQPVPLSQKNEDSDCYSSFNSAVDYCSISSENQYESGQNGERRCPEVSYLNERRGIVSDKILRDSRGNTVLILRPRGSRFKGNRT